MDDHAAFRAEGRGHRQLGKVMLDAPGDDLFGRRRLELLAVLPEQIKLFRRWRLPAQRKT